MEQNNSENFIILPRTTDQWTIREADASHKQYQVFLTSVGEGWAVAKAQKRAILWGFISATDALFIQLLNLIP